MKEPLPASEAIQLRLNRQRQLLARMMRSEAVTRGDPQTALTELTELATELLRVERASFWRFDRREQMIRCEDLFIAAERRHDRGAVIHREQAPRYFDALAAERCIVAEDAHTDPRTREFSEFYLKKLGIGSMLDAPVFVGGEMVGVVCHEHVGASRRWEFWEELLAGTVADFVALVIEAHERVRAERELGIYKSHLSELHEMRASELGRIQAELAFDDGSSAPPSEVEARRMFDASPVPLFVMELEEGRILYANRRAQTLFDVESSGFVGKSAFDSFVHADEKRTILDAIRERSRIENLVVRMRTQKNWPFWALISAQSLSFEGHGCAIVGLSDITAQKVAEAAVRKSEESIRALFAAAPVAMVLARPKEAKVILANQHAADLFDVPPDDVPGLSTHEFYVNPADRDEAMSRLERTGKVDGLVAKLRKRGGREFWTLMSSRTIEFEGEMAVMAGITDITPQKELEAQLRELATRDFLTGAFNRRHFLELGSAEIQRVRRSSRPLSLCILDVDHFKVINDTYGHAVGDEALKLLAEACKKSLRASDVFARFGGEEFVILYPDTDMEGAWVVTERVRETVAESELPVPGGPTTRLTVSGGVAELLPDETLETLLRRADDALYAAKEAGRNRSLRAPAA